MNNESIHFDFSRIHTYCGYFLDNDQLLASASGGAATALSEMIIERGGCVFGAAFSEDYYRSEYKCVESIEGLQFLKGSKYCETVKKIRVDGRDVSAYEVLKDKLNQGKDVLFIGLGCDIAAVYSYCKAKQINTSGLFTVELLCHGPALKGIHEGYIKEIEKKAKSKVIEFSVRYKKEGWTPPYIRAVFENGNVLIKKFYDTDYGYAFGRYSKRSCYNCHFRGNNHLADITIGDYWGLSDKMDNYNKNGVSVLFVQTSKGEKMVNGIDPEVFYLAAISTEFPLKNNPMYYTTRKQPQDYEEFKTNLEHRGLHYAVRHAKTKKEKLKDCIRAILPNHLLDLLRNR